MKYIETDDLSEIQGHMLDDAESFAFKCHSGVSCFNLCCRNLNLFLNPYEPRWFMGAVHLNPADAVKTHLDLESRQSIGIHFGTFQLTYEGIDQPIIDLKKALRENQISDTDFIVPEFGETRLLKF